ncbi:MrfJ [Morganella psychrotolerans]|uniref:MrfJ n=1 Tax=Morganella psychrotolerans TaxID=368603 RepID=A0A5M9R4B0_9GAMM|nr:MrfJ [Morganella psychrotolerans]KAA8715371.1 MrfJ [Morganella psychrotolerans]
MKNIIRYLSVLTVLFLFTLSSAHAEIYSYITRSEGKPKNIDYYYTIAAWSPPARGEPNPCFQAGLSKTCYANINHRHTNANKGGVASRNDSNFNSRCQGNLVNLRDARDVYDYIYNNCFGGLPYSSNTNHVGDPIRNECVTLFLTSKSNAGGGYMFPGAICGVSPPPGGICSFDVGNPNIFLDHGRIQDDMIKGNVASEYLTVKCSKDTVVRVYSISDTESRLQLKQNLYSRLTLNNYPLNASQGGVQMYVRGDYPTEAELKSTLETTGTVAPGAFSGMISIIMTID